MTAKVLLKKISILVAFSLLGLGVVTVQSFAQGGSKSSPVHQISPILQSQQQEIVFHHLTIDDGLSHNSVFHVLQD